MPDRVAFRLPDILDAIEKKERLLEGHDQVSFEADPFVRAAYERFLEIISEASRHLPASMKADAP